MSSPDLYSDRPLLDKLAVKPGARVSVLGFDEPWFLGDLSSRTDDLSTGAVAPDSDVIVVWVDHRDDLDDALRPLESKLARNGAIWVFRPKGSPDIKDTDVIDAGKRARLVDNKIASISPTISGMRLVIPVARR
jgi:hypothetical protein